LRQGGDFDFILIPNQWKTLVNRQNLLEPTNPEQNTPNIKFQTLAQFPSAIDILKVEAINQSGLFAGRFFLCLI
jgi:hypothetical protein